MRALYFDGNGAVYREDMPVPVCLEGHSLIKIMIADICNTDREILKGYRPDFRGIMGHEFVGTVVKSSDPSLVGKTVVGELNEGCGSCRWRPSPNLPSPRSPKKTGSGRFRRER